MYAARMVAAEFVPYSTFVFNSLVLHYLVARAALCKKSCYGIIERHNSIKENSRYSKLNLSQLRQ